MKKRLKFLVLFLVFAIFITLGMSGLYVNIYNSICNLLGFDAKEEIVVVQNVSAYSSETLQTAIENVESVNIMELTLGNDISYEGDTLKSSDLSAGGSSTLYLDLNGHNLSVDTPNSNGIYLYNTTFYSVDTLGGGHLQVNSKNTGITCHNLVIESGDITVEIAENWDWVGPDTPNGYLPPEIDEEIIKEIIEGSDYSTDIDNPLSAEDFYGDLLGQDWWGDFIKHGSNHGEIWNGLPAHIFSNGGGDAIRVLGDGVKAVIGTNADASDKPCHVRLHGSGGCDRFGVQAMFRMQNYHCGIRVGNDSAHVNDGTLTVQNYGGTFASTGGMGLFANVVRLWGGQCEIFGGCGSGSRFDQVGLYFSDPYGSDGYLHIGKSAKVFASTSVNTAGIFSFCCHKATIEGTVFSGCSGPGYYTDGGDLMFQSETSFAGQDHRNDGSGHQKTGIILDIGELYITGERAKVFMLSQGRTMVAGRDPTGSWGMGYPDKGIYGIGANNTPWARNSVWRDGDSIRADDSGTDGWIAGGLTSIITSKNPNPGNLRSGISTLTYQLTHAGYLKIDGGAFVMLRSHETGLENDSVCIFVSGGSGTEENSQCVIGGTSNKLTRVYMMGDDRSIKLEHCNLRIAEGAFVSADASGNPDDWNEIASSVHIASYTEWRQDGANGGGRLVVEKGGVLEVDHWSSSMQIYGIEVGEYITVKSGATLRVYCADSSDSHGSVAVRAWGNAWIETDATVQLRSTGPAIQMRGGNLSISGNNTYCSFVSGEKYSHSYFAPISVWNGSLSIADAEVYAGLEVDSQRSYEAAFVVNNVDITGNAKVNFNNAGKGLTSYGNVNIKDNATYTSRNVKYGIQGNSVNISGNATIKIEADLDAINCSGNISVTGTPKISLNSLHNATGGATGCGIWIDGNTATINMSKGGYLGVSAVGSNYAIGTNNANVIVKGGGIINAEGNTAGIYSGKNITITADSSAGADFSFFGSAGDAVKAVGAITINGAGGTVNCYGQRYGVSSEGDINVSGSVKLVADGTYGGNNSVLSGVSYVSGYTTGNKTGGLTASNIKYNTFAEFAKDNGGGFYSVIGNENLGIKTGDYTKGTVLAAIGEEHINSAGTSSRVGVVNRVDITGGPEEIWYFKYYEGGTMPGTFTIQNYLTKEYLCIDGSKGENGARIITKEAPNEKQSRFYLVHASTLDAAKNGYVIVSGLVGGTFVNVTSTSAANGYGKDFGKFCLDSNGSVGTGTDGCYGTQIHDNIKLHLWSNSDASGSQNNNQIFSINPILDFGTVFHTRIKSVSNNSYLNFNENANSSAFFSTTEKDVFTLTKDASELYPMSYEIKRTKCLDLSGGRFERKTAVQSYTDNDDPNQRFRIVYCLTSGAYSIQATKSPFVVYASSDGKNMRLESSYYHTNRQFIFELDSPYTFIRDGRNTKTDGTNNAQTYYDAMFPTNMYRQNVNGKSTKVVSLKLTLTNGDVNRFVLTTALNNTGTVNPSKWELFESNASNNAIIGNKISSGTMNNSTPAGEKIIVDFNPSNTGNKVYYLVLYPQNNAPFVGVQELSFYPKTAGYAESAGFRTKKGINISVNSGGSVYAKGQKYGLRAYTTISIKGNGSSSVSNLANVKAYGIGTIGKGIVAPGEITTENCTIIAHGNEGGIRSDSVVNIKANSTVDAISNKDASFGLYGKATNGVVISPGASVRTAGCKLTAKKSSIYPNPVDPNGNAIHEVQFHYATVENRDLNSRKYTTDYFKATLSKTKAGVPNYTTLANNYQQYATYFGIGHNDKDNHYSLYFFLPNASYVNIVDGVSDNAFKVNYAVAGYNQADETTGELMFSAKYDMPGFENISNSYITSATVADKYVNVYPLETFYLETFQISTSANGTPLTTAQKNDLAAALSCSDKDDYYTWSEVRYFIEHMATSGQTVYVKVLKKGLAFSTITVPTGVKVELTADSSVNIARATFDTTLTSGDIDSGYINNPQGGTYPLEGATGDTMLAGYDRIKHFYTPSTSKYSSSSGYAQVKTDSNGLELPLFHLNGTADITIGANVQLDNITIGVWTGK